MCYSVVGCLVMLTLSLVAAPRAAQDAGASLDGQIASLYNHTKATIEHIAMAVENSVRGTISSNPVPTSISKPVTYTACPPPYYGSVLRR